jgi:hypothetical protein
VKDNDLEAPILGESLTFFNNHQELFAVDPWTGRVEFVPANEHVGAWTVNFTVVDAWRLSDQLRVRFTVRNVNDPPVLREVPTQHLVEGVPFKLKLMASDPDLANSHDDPGKPIDETEWMQFLLEDTWFPVHPDTGMVSVTPSNDHAQIGTFTVDYRVRDRRGEMDSISVTFIVENVVGPPTMDIIGLTDGQLVVVGRRYHLSATSMDENGLPWTGNIEWFVGTDFLGRGSSLTWEPRREGLAELRVVVRDGEGEDHWETMTVTAYREDGTGPDLSLFPLTVLAFVVCCLAMFFWIRSERGDDDVLVVEGK